MGARVVLHRELHLLGVRRIPSGTDRARRYIHAAPTQMPTPPLIATRAAVLVRIAFVMMSMGRDHQLPRAGHRHLGGHVSGGIVGSVPEATKAVAVVVGEDSMLSGPLVD